LLTVAKMNVNILAQFLPRIKIVLPAFLTHTGFTKLIISYFCLKKFL